MGATSNPHRVGVGRAGLLALVLMVLLPACSFSFSVGGDADLATIPVGTTWAHPTGTTATVVSVDIRESATALQVNFSNPARTQIRMNGCCDHSYLVTDQGEVHPLIEPPANSSLLVEGQAGLETTLFFDGRLGGDTETMVFVFNDRGEGGLTDAGTAWPEMRLGPIPIVAEQTADRSVDTTSPVVGGDTTAAPTGTSPRTDSAGNLTTGVAQSGPANATVPVNQRFEHANGVLFVVEEVILENGLVGLRVVIENPRPISVRINGCCNNSYLLDEFGNRYPYAEIASNPDLKIEGGSGVRATLAFEGRLTAGARNLTFVFNDRSEGGLTDPDTSWPEFRLGPFGI